MMPKKICFANLKGGVGKTTNAFNIGGILSEDSKVLFIDMDPQCNLTKDCGVNVKDVSIPSAYNIFASYRDEEDINAEDVIYHNPIKSLPNIDIIPASIWMFKFWKDLFGRNKILDSFIQMNNKTLSKYDYIIMDTSPSLGLFNVNAFYAADSIIINTDHDDNSIMGVEMFCGLWDAEREDINKTTNKSKIKNNNIKAILFSRYQKNTNFSKDAYEYLSETYFSKDILLESVIPQTVSIPRSGLHSKPINIFEPQKNKNIIAAYKKVIEELRDREVF